MRAATTHRGRPTTAADRRSASALGLAVLAVTVLSACGGPSTRIADAPATNSEVTSQGPEVTQNGWPAISDGHDPRLVPFPWVTGRVLDGDVYTVLAHFAERFDAEIEPIDLDSSWGWEHRPVRGHGDMLSNHASGTAIDFNATAHPLRATGTFSDEQVVRLRELLDEVAPVLVWGGDFERPDEMHFEIAGAPAEVADVAARITGP